MKPAGIRSSRFSKGLRSLAYAFRTQKSEPQVLFSLRLKNSDSLSPFSENSSVQPPPAPPSPFLP